MLTIKIPKAHQCEGNNMDKLYVYQAVRRTKENDNIVGPRIIREVSSYTNPINILKKATADYPGIWRIYRSVNARNVNKAEVELVKTLVDRINDPSSASNKPIPSLWKTILMQPRNKAERLYLIDIDTVNSEVPAAINRLLDGKVHMSTNTPNGYHLIAEPFDIRLVESIEDVSVLKDGLLFIEKYEVK